MSLEECHCVIPVTTFITSRYREHKYIMQSFIIYVDAFYKILFILSIICPIVLFIFRICTGFFSYTHDFNGLPYKFYDTPFYQVFINILKTYQIFQPIIIIIYNLIIVKKDKYNFSAFLINIILFILGIDDFLQYIKMFFLGLFLEIYNL